jgi:hypothetical protein
VIWLLGGDGKATEFLDGIRRRTWVIDVAPQGLVTGRNTGWINPWEADIPSEARDNLVDLRFISALEDLVRARFGSIRRVWLCGFSAGGGLVWSAWALRSTINHSLCGLCAVGKKLRPTPENGWIWKAAAVSPFPLPWCTARRMNLTSSLLRSTRTFLGKRLCRSASRKRQHHKRLRTVSLRNLRRSVELREAQDRVRRVCTFRPLCS